MPAKRKGQSGKKKREKFKGTWNMTRTDFSLKKRKLGFRRGASAGTKYVKERLK